RSSRARSVFVVALLALGGCAQTSPEKRAVDTAGLPPLSGGTLLITQGDAFAVLSDPDRDRVFVISGTALSGGGGNHRAVALNPGDQPGRIVEDAAGRVHVVLRGGGEIAVIDPAAATLLERRPVCAA